jgi:hypothetical protein
VTPRHLCWCINLRPKGASNSPHDVNWSRGLVLEHQNYIPFFPNQRTFAASFGFWDACSCALPLLLHVRISARLTSIPQTMRCDHEETRTWHIHVQFKISVYTMCIQAPWPQVQPRMEYFFKNCICPEHIQTFISSLFNLFLFIL